MTIAIYRSPVPVNIICGALGAGKTTAIAQLLSSKPADQTWVVILNEFTDTGIDTLTLAAAARGSLDVRMVPGGCLCCTGEEDFRQQLSTLLNHSQLPARILVEPSGIGHPGAIVQELQLFERSGAIKLMSTIVLVEPALIAEIDNLTETARNQIDAADVIVMSKAENAAQPLRSQFESWAHDLFPAKRLISFSERGAIPVEALSPPPLGYKRFTQRGNHHQHDHHDGAHQHNVPREVAFGSAHAVAHTHDYLNRHGCGWVIPASVMFDLRRIERDIRDAVRFENVERFKAALRTGIDRWHLVQRWNNQYDIREIAWRNDSRAEIQIDESIDVDWQQWDDWLITLTE